MKPGATFDRSSWVHAVYLNLVECLIEDYALVCSTAVETELGADNLTAVKLQTLCAAGLIQRVTRYGQGERAAMNLALERKRLLLIDEWRPYEAARAAGIATVNTVAYLTHLGRREQLSPEQVLEALAKLARRGTIKAEWIATGVQLVADIRQQRRTKDHQPCTSQPNRKPP